MSTSPESPTSRSSQTERNRRDIDAFWSAPSGTVVGALALVVMIGGVILGVTGVF